MPDAHVSDYLIVTARTKESDDPNEGITAFIVDAKSAGINYEVLKTIASDKQCEVELDMTSGFRGPTSWATSTKAGR